MINASVFLEPAVLVAFFNFAGMAVSGFFAWRASARAKESLEASKSNAAVLYVVKEGVKVVEVATNSMKDELVRATAKASFAEGVKEQKDNPS